MYVFFLLQAGSVVYLEIQVSKAGVISMQSYLTPFFPNTDVAKQEMHSLYSRFVHVFGMPSENTSQGCHITPKMGYLPVLFIKRSVLLTGSAILTVVVRYRALLDTWILHKFTVSQVSSSMVTKITLIHMHPDFRVLSVPQYCKQIVNTLIHIVA